MTSEHRLWNRWRRSRIYTERTDLLVLFLVGSIAVATMALYPDNVHARADVRTDRVVFRFADTMTEGLPPSSDVDLTTFSGFSTVLIRRALLDDMPRDAPKDIRITPDGADARIIAPGGHLQWRAIPRGTRIAVGHAIDDETARTSVSSDTGAVVIQLDVVPPVDLECQHCIVATELGEQSLGSVARFVVNGEAPLRMEIEGSIEAFGLDFQARRPFAWTGFLVTEPRFVTARPLRPASSINGGSVSFSARSQDVRVRSGEALVLEAEAPLAADIVTADGELAVVMTGSVSGVTVGAERYSFSWFSRIQRSQWWTALAAGIAFGLALLNLIDKVKLKVQSAP